MSCVRRSLRGRGRFVGPVSAVAALVAVAVLVVAGPQDVTRAAVPTPLPASVTVDPWLTVATVPRSFLGASTEYWVPPRSHRRLVLFERALSLLRAPGDGPLVIRIGGDSADRSLWDPQGIALPPWLFEITPRWLRAAAWLVRDLGARLILDLNLAIDSPKAEAAWARAARAALPAGSIVGFEIGNEPDLHTRGYLLGAVTPTDASGPSQLLGITPRGYVRAFLAYGRALARVAPGVALLGPVVSGSPLDVRWISALVDGARGLLGAVSAHAYPLSACARPGSSGYPTIDRVLSENTSAGVAREVEPGVRLAESIGVPLRLTELNSITCGGLGGVSNAFATALWAPDTLFELVRAGVASADIHIRADTINAPFVLRGDRLEARPLLYGLALFARTLGPGARLVDVRVRAAPSLHLKVWAVRLDGGRLHVLIINKGDRSALVDLRVPAVGPTSVVRLLAPSASSRSGVTLAGQLIDDHGRWSGRRRVETTAPHRGALSVFVPRMSAALVSVDSVSPSRLGVRGSRSAVPKRGG
jgi:hypothetical protein